MRAVVPVVLVSVMVGLLLATPNYQPDDPGPPPFVQTSWLSDTVTLSPEPYYDQGGIESPTSFQIWTDTFKNNFKLRGVYQGEDFYGVEHPPGEPRMQFTRTLRPDDGVADVFGLPRVINGSLNMTVFFDDRFLELVGDPAVLRWNKQTDTKQVTELEYHAVTDGVYRATVTDDAIMRSNVDPDYVPAFIYVGDVREEGWINIPPNGTAFYLY